MASTYPCNPPSLAASLAYSPGSSLASFVRYAISEGSSKRTEALHFRQLKETWICSSRLTSTQSVSGFSRSQNVNQEIISNRIWNIVKLLKIQCFQGFLRGLIDALISVFAVKPEVICLVNGNLMLSLNSTWLLN